MSREVQSCKWKCDANDKYHQQAVSPSVKKHFNSTSLASRVAEDMRESMTQFHGCVNAKRMRLDTALSFALSNREAVVDVCPVVMYFTPKQSKMPGFYGMENEHYRKLRYKRIRNKGHA